MSTIPLSYFGITKEDKQLLENRLFPAANKIFLERLAQENGVEKTQIEMLDYANHPLYVQEQWMKKRLLKKKMLDEKIKNGYDISKFEYPFKSIEEANDKEPGKHILANEPETVEDLEKRIKNEKYSEIAKKIVRFKKDFDLDSISEEDEKSVHIV